MSKLHKSQYDAPKFEPNEGQRGLLCSNKASMRCPSLSSNATLSTNTLDALEQLGGILRGIHNRMIAEGYQIVNNKIEKIKS